MAWIRMVEEDEAEGTLKAIYTKRMDKEGNVGGVIKAGCWNVPYLSARSDLFHALMYRREGLSRAEREFIAVVTSVVNKCEY